MSRQATSTYSRITRHAATLLGKQIRIARKEHKMTAQDLADRAGISRGLLQRIEKGNLTCRIGADDKIALLPKHIHPGKKVVDDDF
jgi:DNA-binding XRE family transcriptional regulator